MLKWTTDLPTEVGVYLMTNDPDGFNDLDNNPERRELIPVRRVTNYEGQTRLEYWDQRPEDFREITSAAFPESADGQPWQFFGPIPLPQPVALLKDGNGEVIDGAQIGDEESLADIDVRR